jgi:DNA-binding response OmpR family regulator
MDKLLVVDDEEAIRRMLRINLSDGYEIIDTGDPGQALALALQEKPNAILLDLRMPKYSGFELCQTFHSLTFTQLIPLIIVTGEAGATTKSICKELGAAGYFEKPIDFEALRAGLESVLSAARPERRSELRVRLRVMLDLRGVDMNGKSLEETSATENVSHSGFFCGCVAKLREDSTIEVGLGAGKTRFTGKARLIRSEACDTHYPRYAFRFIEKNGDWILK